MTKKEEIQFILIFIKVIGAATALSSLQSTFHQSTKPIKQIKLFWFDWVGGCWWLMKRERAGCGALGPASRLLASFTNKFISFLYLFIQQFRPSIKEISFLLIMGGAAKPFKFNSFSINPSILKEWVDEKNEFDWAAAYNAHFTMFNFMNFTFVSLIPQKKNSIIKHSSIPVINYCYNIILFPFSSFHTMKWIKWKEN